MELVEGEPLSARLARGGLPVEQVLRYGQQLADALAHAHDRRVVHRDLKPANIVITPEGRTKILDFGLARRLLGEELTDATTATRDSLTAPLPADIPVPLQTVVRRCLAKDPGERYQRGSDVKAALEAVQAGTAPAAWPARRHTLRRRWLFGLGAAAAALLLLGFALVALNLWGLQSQSGGAASAPPRVITLAVLPFEDPGGDADQEYFSDGQTQEMIARLARLQPESLLVKARASVMRYKKTEKPPDLIGRELGVEYLLEGSVQREAGRVRFWAELIKVADQTQVWGNRYDRKEEDIQALHSEIAQKVASALALRLLPVEQARLTRVQPVDPKAYDAYLKGTQYRQRLTKESLDAAEQYFTLALQKEPGYAAAWAGMARVWTGRQQMGFAQPREARPKAREAAEKALALDDESLEARRALAGILTWGEWNWPAAERAWNELIKLDPDNPEVLQGRSHFLMHMGRPREAMADIERARDLDPFSVRTLSFYAADLVYAHRYDDAIAAASKALGLQADAPVARGALYQALLLKGSYAEALAMDRDRYAKDDELMRALDSGSATGGYVGAQKKLVGVWTARFGRPGGLRAWDLAMRSLYAGDRDAALLWLERAYAE